MKTNICLLLLILVASNQVLCYPSKQELAQELAMSGAEVSACIVKKHVANKASDALNAVKDFFGMRRRLNRVTDYAKDVLKKGLVRGCTEVAVKLVEFKIKPIVGEDVWKRAGNQCTRDLCVTKCQAQVNKVVGRRLVATQTDSKTWVQKFVSESQVKKFRNYAVTDLTQYIDTDGKSSSDWISKYIPDAELHHAWALYEKWHTRTDGAYGGVYPKEIQFQYVPGKNRMTKPTIDVAKGTAGAKQAKMVGWGQCDYFAKMAYNKLSVPAVGPMAGKAPIVTKLSTPGHNWVIVNYQPAQKANWMLVDLWLYAMGVPYNNSICPTSGGIVGFQDQKITPLNGSTYDPNQH